jgi:hypothetical protein
MRALLVLPLGGDGRNTKRHATAMKHVPRRMPIMVDEDGVFFLRARRGVATNLSLKRYGESQKIRTKTSLFAYTFEPIETVSSDSHESRAVDISANFVRLRKQAPRQWPKGLPPLSQ